MQRDHHRCRRTRPALGTLVGTLSAEDPTEGSESHTYALFAPQGVLGCNLSFEIRGNSLYTARPFDYERKNSCRIWIQTHDAHANLKTCHFDVVITDVPEDPYDLYLRNYGGVYENLPAGTVVGTLVTKDDDTDTHTYQLVSGEGDTDNALFTLEGDKLRTNAVFDYEAGASRSILVRATDSTGAALTKQLTVEILDIADAAVVSRIADLGTDDEVPATAEFSVSDQDTALSALRFSAVSDNPDVLPAGNIRFGGTGKSRSVILTPVTGMSGTANVTVSVSDGSTSTETGFALNVTTGPELRASAQISTDADGTVPPGGTLRCAVTISNTGDRDAVGVAYALPLPENTEYAAESCEAMIRSVFRTAERASDPVYDSELGQIGWSGDIGAGETAEISFELKVRPGTSVGESVRLRGTVSYDTDGDGISDVTRNTDEIGDDVADAELTVAGCLEADIDGNGIIDLEDAVRVMRALIGTNTGEICGESDVNGDERIGHEELIRILMDISE